MVVESRKIHTEDLNKLFHLLERLVQLHQGLIELILQEKHEMSDLNMQGMLECAQSKENLITEIFNHENLRLQVLTEICGSLNINSETTLLGLSSYTDEESFKKLKNIRTTLNLLMEKAKDLNQQNMAFANESMERIDEMKKNILGLGNNTKENYSQGGMRTPMPEQGGRFLTTEA